MKKEGYISGINQLKGAKIMSSTVKSTMQFIGLVLVSALITISLVN